MTNRKSSLAVVAALCCLVVVYIVLHGLQPRVHVQRTRDVADLASRQPVQARVGPAGPTRDPQTHIKPLVAWREVPSRVGMHPLPLAISARSEDWVIPACWRYAFAKAQSDRLFGADPSESDLVLRSLGFIQAVDHVLLTALGCEVQRVRVEPRYYFPLPIDDAPKATMTVDSMVEKWIALWQTPQSVAGSVPPQFQSDDLLDPVRARLLVFAANLYCDNRVQEVLAKEFLENPDPRMKVAAASALICGGREHATADWVRGLPEGDTLDGVLAVLGSHPLAGFVVDGPAFKKQNLAPLATSGRSLDDWILTTARVSTRRETRELAVVALTGRTDIPAVREFLITSASPASEPWLAAVIFRETPALESHPAYVQSVRHWVGSTDRRAALWALHAAQNAPLNDVIDVMSPLVLGDDDQLRSAALLAVHAHAAWHPTRAIELVAAAERLYPKDPDVRMFAPLIREQASLHQTDPLAHDREIERALRNGWRRLPQ